MNFHTFLGKTRSFLDSLAFAILVFVAASFVVIFKFEVYGALLFIMLISLILVISRDILPTLLPFLLLCCFVTKCYDSFDTFIKFAPLAAIPIVALIFHFIAYRQAFKVSHSFYGICAVAVAVTMGGAFIISEEDYFSGTSVFYILALGIGMALLYLLLKSAYTEREEYSVKKRFAAIMYIMGLFGSFMVIQYYISDFAKILADKAPSIQWSNNISTLIMFALPFPFYFALKHNRFHIISALVMYVSVFATGSRGGALMATIELVLCFIYVSIFDKPLLIVSALLVSVTSLTVIINFDAAKELFASFFKINDIGSFVSKSEVRYELLLRAIDDFKANPIFGRGIGYTGNAGQYSPVKGAANWYHMMLFQIIGSLGIVGIIAYGFQFVGRLLLIFKKTDRFKLAMGLSYAGILLMSQVNPGEFCPVPYEMLTVLIFIILELPHEKNSEDGKRAFPPLQIKLFKKKTHSAVTITDWWE